MGQLVAHPGVHAGLRFMREEVGQGLVDIIEACPKRDFVGRFVCERGACREGFLRGRRAGGGGL